MKNRNLKDKKQVKGRWETYKGKKVPKWVKDRMDFEAWKEGFTK